MSKREFNLTVAPFWNTKNENITMSIEIGQEEFDALQRIAVGGKLMLKRVVKKSNPKSPDYYLEYITPEEVSKFKASREQSGSQGATRERESKL